MSTSPANPQASTGAQSEDPYFWTSLATAALFASILPAIILLVAVSMPEPQPVRWELEAADLGLTRFTLASGASTYQKSCAVCHGPDAQGVANLGKPLRNSAFVQSQSDEALLELIVKGRAPSDPANTTGALMPPRGAQGLSDERIHEVVWFMRAIQDREKPVVAVDAWDLRDAAGGGVASVAIELDGHAGYELYLASCAACHGVGAEGLEGLGLPLSTSGFVRSKSDKDLITFIKMGRPIWDENNVTGLDMPPKGGNPAITDEQLQSIVDYLQAVQASATGG